MNTTYKMKWLSILFFIISSIIFVQMSLFILHKWLDTSLEWNIMKYCLIVLSQYSIQHSTLEIGFKILLGFTVVLIVWRLWKQGFLTYKMNKFLRKSTDTVKTEILSGRNQHIRSRIIVVHEDSFTAFAFGLFRPKIVISNYVMDHYSEKEVNAILLHEEHHCKRYDPLKVFMMTTVSDAMIYLPVLRGLVHYYKVGIELLAGRYVIRKMGSTYELGMVLLKLGKSSVHRETMIVGVPFANIAINYRIQQLLEPSQSTEMPIFRSTSIILSIVVMFMMALYIFGKCI